MRLDERIKTLTDMLGDFLRDYRADKQEIWLAIDSLRESRAKFAGVIAFLTAMPSGVVGAMIMALIQAKS